MSTPVCDPESAESLESRSPSALRILFFVSDFQEPFLDGNQSAIYGWMKALAYNGVDVRAFTPLAGRATVLRCMVKGIPCIEAPAIRSTRLMLGAWWRVLREYRPDMIVVRTLARPRFKHKLFYLAVTAFGILGSHARIAIAPWGGDRCIFSGVWPRRVIGLPPVPVPGDADLVSPGVVLGELPPPESDDKEVDFVFINGTSVLDSRTKRYLLHERGLESVFGAISRFRAFAPHRPTLRLCVPTLATEGGRQWLAEKLHSHGLEGDVEVLGAVTDLRAAVGTARFLLLPHLFRDLFWFPYSVLEAMRLGTVPMLTDSDVSRILVRHGADGFLLDPSDRVGSLVGAMTEGFASPERYQQLREAAQEAVRERFSLEARHADIARVFHSLCKGTVS